MLFDGIVAVYIGPVDAAHMHIDIVIFVAVSTYCILLMGPSST